MISHKIMASPIIPRYRLDPLSLLLSALEQALIRGNIFVSKDNDTLVEDTPVDNDYIFISYGGVEGLLIK